MKLKTGRKILSFLLTIALLLGLMQGLGLTGFTYDDNPYAALVPTSSDDSNALNDKLISFNGNMWYIIEDNSTAVNSGTVTLLHATFLAKVPFSSSRDHTAYKDSSIEDFLNGYYEGSFAQFSNAIVPTDLDDVSVTGAKLYLLSTAEVQSLPDNVKKIGCDWWLRTQGNMQCGTFVGEFGNIANSVTYVTSSLAARPALRLDLSKVIFSDKTFSLDEDHNFTYTASGSTITAVCSAENCSLPLVDGRHTATLTIAAPKHNTYGDGKDAAAVITDAYRIRGDAKISYQKKNGSNYGTASETAPTDVGDYKASITIGSATASIEYTIARVDPGMSLTYSPEEPVYLELATVTANLPSDAEGTVTFTPEGLDNFEKTVDVSNGKAVYEFRLKRPDGGYHYPGAGTHNIKAEYSGDDKYSPVTLNDEFTIAPATPEINLTVSPENPVYGDSVIIEAVLYENASGNVTFTVTGDNYNFTSDEIVLKDGVAQIELDSLISGNYTVKADYTGDDDFNPGSKETLFTVGKIDPGMTVTVTPQNPASDGTFTLTVNLPDDATGNVIIRFNEVDLLGYIQLANGNSQDFNCLQSGRYSGTAKYMPDDGSNYKEVTVEFSFNVSAAAPNMTLTAEDITYGETATVTANLPRDTMWGSVTFYLDSADTGKEVYVSQGNAVCTFAGLNAGEHTVEAVFANDDKYADETKTITFNVAQKELTITANDQSYPFNNQMQGEDGTTYTNSADISEKVTVDNPVTGDTLTSIVLTGQAKDIDEYEGKIVPSSAVIKNSGGRDVTTNYNITYTSGKLTITSVNAPLTVNYVYAKGGEAAETHTEDVEIFTGYSVTSPEITGYTPDKATVEGTMESLDGVTETVTYTPIEYTATFVDENGETVEAITFTVETESITEPAVPEKTNYTGKWEEYTLGTADITIKPIYTLGGETTVKAVDTESEITLGYKESKRFAFEPEFIPDGATAHVFYNGEDRGEGTSIEVKEPTDDYTVECKVLDKDGNEIATSGEIKVKVKNSFFDRLKWFFNNFWANILKTFIDALIAAC